jgi:hypothetical protein
MALDFIRYFIALDTGGVACGGAVPLLLGGGVSFC